MYVLWVQWPKLRTCTLQECSWLILSCYPIYAFKYTLLVHFGFYFLINNRFLCVHLLHMHDLF